MDGHLHLLIQLFVVAQELCLCILDPSEILNLVGKILDGAALVYADCKLVLLLKERHKLQ